MHFPRKTHGNCRVFLISKSNPHTNLVCLWKTLILYGNPAVDIDAYDSDLQKRPTKREREAFASANELYHITSGKGYYISPPAWAGPPRLQALQYYCQVQHSEWQYITKSCERKRYEAYVIVKKMLAKTNLIENYYHFRKCTFTAKVNELSIPSFMKNWFGGLQLCYYYLYKFNFLS